VLQQLMNGFWKISNLQGGQTLYNPATNNEPVASDHLTADPGLPY